MAEGAEGALCTATSANVSSLSVELELEVGFGWVLESGQRSSFPRLLSGDSWTMPSGTSQQA